jgi:hypothetical protein
MATVSDVRRAFGSKQILAILLHEIEKVGREIKQSEASQRGLAEICRTDRRYNLGQRHRLILNGQDAHSALVSMERGACGIRDNSSSGLNVHKSRETGSSTNCPIELK